ncbi:MAG: sugar phosphate nucleotidyltransferase [Candidatus Hadarchaeales archaeon]
MKALVLAGGFARRLGPIGENLPKAVLVEGEKSILDHLIGKLERAGLETYVSTNRKFADYFQGYRNLIIEETTREEEKLGAVAAINHAIKTANIDDDLLVVCVDNYFSDELKGFVSSFRGDAMVGLYYIGDRPDVKAEEMGTVRFEGSDRRLPPGEVVAITEFREKARPPLSQYIAVGLYAYPRRIFPLIEEFCRGSHRDAPGTLIQYLVERGERVRGYLMGGEWRDVSHRSYLTAFADARLVRSDERYVVCDKALSDHFVASITILKPGKHTTGHSHPVAEAYFFVEGMGEIETDEGRRRAVGPKDIVLIKPNEFHRVYNTGRTLLIFISAFERYGERG